MNPTRKRRIKDINSVCGKEEDTLEVLEHAKEDGYKGITANVVVSACFEEDVGFVEEEEGAPSVRHVEDFGQFALERGGVDAELAY